MALIALTFDLAAGFALAFARAALALAATVLGLAGLFPLRFAAGFTLEAAFREDAGLAAALPRLVVFAMVLASIPRQLAPLAATT